LTEENRVSIDTIGQLMDETNDIKSKHARKLVVLQEEKKEMSKNHENQVNVLVAQINELNIKQKSSELLKTKAMEISDKLASLKELFYTKLNEIKG
jgi:hypothetical protein